MGKVPSCHPLGPLLRLEGLDFAALPPTGASRDRIQQFMSALLQESLYLVGSVDTYYNNVGQITNPSGWASKGKQTYKGVSQIGGGGTIVVDLMERKISKTELRAAIAQVAVAQSEDGENAHGSNSAAGNAPIHHTKKNATSETWACRRSRHNNEAAAGTASWEEFSVRMKDMHVETEKAMTPTIPRAQKVLHWAAAGLVNTLEIPGFEDSGPGPWTGFTLDVVEMEHDLKAGPLWHRVFPVLQMTCRTANEATYPEILVVSVPINGWKEAQLPPDVRVQKLVDSPNVVVGSYVSVERFRVVAKMENNGARSDKKVSKFSRVMGSLRKKRHVSVTESAASAEAAAATAAAFPAEARPSVPVSTESAGQGDFAQHMASASGPGQGDNSDEIQAHPAAEDARENITIDPESSDINEMETQIEWTMATASHARGWLPLFVQTPAVPKKIAVDVPLFFKFLHSQRAEAAALVKKQNGSPSAADTPTGDARPE
ncbi:hypothetical protein SEPCBS119000_006201 [Sporothrix epigloea]|uniref:DUF3074 domain-containing protein n=1 Tax=Sporothrix epigloea TaxID=1892477 RepID=A0ABP0E1Q5_9PEZI